MTLVEVLIALVIAGVTLAGIVEGYEYTLSQTVKDSIYMEANARAQERLEQVRAARWVVTTPTIDELQDTNFPPETLVLDQYAQSSNVLTALVKTSISDITTSPPIRSIHIDCIWQFQGVQWVTNSIETDRAPDQ